MIKKFLEFFAVSVFCREPSILCTCSQDRVETGTKKATTSIVRPMNTPQNEHADLTGSLLVAVPTLLDPNFRRSIIFLTRHETKEGALGVILNRPSGRTLGELTESPDDLKEVPVFEGGPVEQQQLLLARILLMEQGVRFESFDQEESLSMADNRGFRAFTGYAGWSEGQLESEIRQKSWLILPPTAPLLKAVTTPEEGLSRWRGIMRELGPWYRLLAEAPDDLSLN